MEETVTSTDITKAVATTFPSPPAVQTITPLQAEPESEKTEETEAVVNKADEQNNTSEPFIRLLGGAFDRSTPLEKLVDCLNGSFVDKQRAVRSIMETLHYYRGSIHDLRGVLQIFTELAADREHTIRMEIAELLPHVTAYFIDQVICCLSRPVEFLQIALSSFENLLVDENPQVRKVAQNSLTSTLEQGFIGKDFIEQKITKVILRLMEHQEEEYRIEGLITLNKVLRYMEKETIEKLFVDTFCQHTIYDNSFIRRVCASNFGELCTMLGQETTEKTLLHYFKLLCEDQVWGVRKSCADVFVPVSCVCSNEAKRNILAPLFVKLLCDHSKWVKNAAFQALGPFISTFADPSKTGLYYNDGSVIVVDDGKDHESNDSGCSVYSGESNTSPELEECEVVLESELKSLSIKGPSETEVQTTSTLNHNIEGNAQNETQGDFDTFLYWRDPLPEIENEINELYLDLSDIKQDDNLIENLNESKPLMNVENYQYILELFYSSFFTNEQLNPCYQVAQRVKSFNAYDSFENLTACSPSMLLNLNNENSKISLKKPIMKQDIIPSDLLEHYLNMTTAIYRNSIDTDLTQYCAYSLPAVALTLGRRYWPCLRETYMQLASDMHWKVRWTLASSLHQMSLILGPHYTTQDLVPVFLSFMIDLDEVRFGILQNLSSILEVFNRTEQLMVLPKLSDFLKMDYPRNWRFRCTLAHQLVAISHIYSASEVVEFILPIGFNLILDKIAEVRRSAIHLLSSILKRVFCDTKEISPEVITKEKQDSIFNDLKTYLVTSKKWCLRQAFVLLTEHILNNNSLPLNLFIEYFLDHLDNLASDKVANVRLTVARCLENQIMKIDLLKNNEKVKDIYKKLEKDTDRDVRLFLNLAVFNYVVGIDVSEEEDLF